MPLSDTIHAALTPNSAYAIGAVVTVRNAIQQNSGSITIFVIDCGLSLLDREGIQAAVPPSRLEDVSLTFISLQSDSLAHSMGATGMGAMWAKIDMLEILPVDCVIYLDADLLIRSSLRPLWDTDLDGKCLAAVQDVAHPMGFKDGATPYFNAGLLLCDLAKIRPQYSDVKKVARARSENIENARFGDEEALNTYFSDWKRLGPEWNAQGLGSPAEGSIEALHLSAGNDPRIVHFTGPKPWGLSGCRGDPFEKEWRSVLEETPWTEGQHSKA